jgi:hypothetical protein
MMEAAGGTESEVNVMTECATVTHITGRFTLQELEHLAGTLAWPRGVPETVSDRDNAELCILLRQAADYIELTPNACAVDVLEGQIVNVVTC